MNESLTGGEDDEDCECVRTLDPFITEATS